MKKIILCLIITIFSQSFSQTKRIKEILFSSNLNQDVEILIELPKSYEKEVKRNYPFILLLDGDYFMDVFSGNLSFGNYWELYPECILIGINHLGGNEERIRNFSFNEETGVLLEDAISFYDFVRLELLPNLRKSFRLLNFSIIGGYDYSAGFLNNFLLLEPNLFNGYLVISPEMHESKTTLITNKLQNNPKKNVYYYVATSTNDDVNIKKNTALINEDIQTYRNSLISNTTAENTNIPLAKLEEKFKFSYNIFEGYSHYATISVAIPSSLNFIFNAYKPIDQYEYDNYIKNLTEKQTQYLIDKYQNIVDNFGFRQPYRPNDIKIIEDHILKIQNYDELLVLAELCKKEFPKTLLDKYFTGLYHEKRNEMMLALKNYKSAFPKENYGAYNKDLVFDKIENARN